MCRRKPVCTPPRDNGGRGDGGCLVKRRQARQGSRDVWGGHTPFYGGDASQMKPTPFLSGRLLPVFVALAAACACAAALAQPALKTLVIGTIDMPPHSSADAAKPSLSRELFQHAMASQGYAVDIRFYPWARAYELGKQGEVDAVWPAIHQPDRETWFMFGSPVIRTHYVLIKRRNLPVSFRGLEDAKPYIIATLRGGITGSRLDATPSDYRIEPGSSFEQNLKKLAAGRIDFMTSERYTGAYLLSTEFQTLSESVEMLMPPISGISFHLMFAKNAPAAQEKMQAFERGLRLMRANGLLADILRRHGYDVAMAKP